MKDGQDPMIGGQRSSFRQDDLARGIPRPSPRRGAGQVAARPAVLRVVIRPARPDDLEEATLIERRVWGRLGASLKRRF